MFSSNPIVRIDVGIKTFLQVKGMLNLHVPYQWTTVWEQIDLETFSGDFYEKSGPFGDKGGCFKPQHDLFLTRTACFLFLKLIRSWLNILQKSCHEIIVKIGLGFGPRTTYIVRKISCFDGRYPLCWLSIGLGRQPAGWRPSQLTPPPPLRRNSPLIHVTWTTSPHKGW